MTAKEKLLERVMTHSGAEADEALQLLDAHEAEGEWGSLPGAERAASPIGALRRMPVLVQISGNGRSSGLPISVDFSPFRCAASYGTATSARLSKSSKRR